MSPRNLPLPVHLLTFTYASLLSSASYVGLPLGKKRWKAGSFQPGAAFLCFTCMLWNQTTPAHGQVKLATIAAASGELPDAPSPQHGELTYAADYAADSAGNYADQAASATGQAQGQTHGEGSISGTVVDSSGAAIAGARIRLSSAAGLPEKAVIAGADGSFALTNLPAGTYTVLVDAKGFGSFTSASLDLADRQALSMLPVSLTVGATTTDVEVRPTEVIAAAQIKQEEKQRVLGIIPNYYISYTWNAAPMTTRQKYSLAAHDEFDWTSFVGAGIGAGIEQANNSYKGYGQGAAGYGKRYAALFGTGMFENYFAHAVYPSIFHQDPRYFYQGSGTKKSRALHAASFALWVRNDKGQDAPNYSFLLAAMTAGALSNLYYPHADRGANLVFTNAAIGIAGRAAGTVLREFLLKPLTTNVPGDGKP